MILINMDILKRLFAGSGIFALIIFLVIFFAPALRNAPKEGIHIVVSFYPLEYIVSAVGGSFVTVDNILPSGGEPHDYEPSPRKFADLSKSDLFIYNGGDFEPWVNKWEKGTFARPKRTLDMVEELGRRGASLIEMGGRVDPHIWLDPMLYKQEVEIVRDALIDIDPLHSADYQSNAVKLLTELDLLDGHFRDALRDCRGKDIIVSHSAFAYLARQYGFNAIAIAGISPDEEPSPKALANLVSLARAKDIKYVFFETTVSSKLSETIAREINAETLVLNTLESLTTYDVQSGEGYTSIMSKNLNNLSKALICR